MYQYKKCIYINLASLQLPISAMGCLTPISLFTAITDTKTVSGRIFFSNSWITFKQNCYLRLIKTKCTSVLWFLCLTLKTKCNTKLIRFCTLKAMKRNWCGLYLYINYSIGINTHVGHFKSFSFQSPARIKDTFMFLNS